MNANWLVSTTLFCDQGSKSESLEERRMFSFNLVVIYIYIYNLYIISYICAYIGYIYICEYKKLKRIKNVGIHKQNKQS